MFIARPSEALPATSGLSNIALFSAGYQTTDNSLYIGNSNMIFSKMLVNGSYINNAENWRTYLANNPQKVYYPLATPTNTEITYQPLIDQLNALELAQSKENQTNISQVNNDLPFIISAEAILSLKNVLDRIELLES